METWGKWKLVQAGFWLGIGFIIPELIVYFGGTMLTVQGISSMYDMPDSTEISDVMSDMDSNFDRSDQIKILEYHDINTDGRVRILGSVENAGEKPASSIQLEAELTDSKGEFVYECSKYISKRLRPGDIENFQINCGCSDERVPEYSNITVRVISAHDF